MKNQSRVGKQVNSIFASTTHVEYEPIVQAVPEKPIKELSKHPGRPQRTNRKTIKATLTMYVDQVVWLDRLSADILCNSGSIIDRGSILRGILSAIQESKINMKDMSNEEDIASTLKEILLK